MIFLSLCLYFTMKHQIERQRWQWQINLFEYRESEADISYPGIPDMKQVHGIEFDKYCCLSRYCIDWKNIFIWFTILENKCGEAIHRVGAYLSFRSNWKYHYCLPPLLPFCLERILVPHSITPCGSSEMERVSLEGGFLSKEAEMTSPGQDYF